MTDYIEEMKMAAATQATIKDYDERLNEAGDYLKSAEKVGEGMLARPAREAVIEACRILHINRGTAEQFADVYEVVNIVALSGAQTELGLAIGGEAEDRKCLSLEAVVGVPLDPRDALAAPIALTLTDAETGERASSLASLGQIDDIVSGIRGTMKEAYGLYPPEMMMAIFTGETKSKE